MVVGVLVETLVGMLSGAVVGVLGGAVVGVLGGVVVGVLGGVVLAGGVVGAGGTVGVLRGIVAAGGMPNGNPNIVLTASWAIQYNFKIIAISGMAQQLQQLWEDEYCAGLWRKHLGLQLCWWAVPPTPECTPKALRAPSWSWLSFDGPVQCTQPQLYEAGYDRVSLATVTDVHLRQEICASGNKVIRGHLNLRCILNPVAFNHDIGKFHTTGENSRKLPIHKVDLDYSNSTSGRLFFIPSYEISYQSRLESPINDMSEIRGILVRLWDEASGSYVRCGHVFVAGRAGKGGFEPEYADLKIAKGKEKLPCADFDGDKGHLILLV